MVRVSVIYLTYRPGGYDILAAGLTQQTHDNIELIIVDDYPGRREKVQEYLESQDIYASYIGPSKKKCFPEIAFNDSNAHNTGIMMSTGDILVILTDYTYLHEDTIERFVNKIQDEPKACVSAVANIWAVQPADLTDPISIFKKHWDGTAIENGGTSNGQWRPQKFEVFCSAFPWAIIRDTNGFPEKYDALSSRQPESIYFFEDVGAHLIVDPGNIVDVIDHRNWTPNHLWHTSKKIAEGSRDFIERENCFDLKTHTRGTLP